MFLSPRWGRAAVALLCSLPALSLATVVVAESVEKLTQASDLVVRGRIGAEQVSWNEDHTQIVTLTELVTLERVKGEAPSTLLVAQPGGTIDGKTMTVSGAAKFREGEEVVLFLKAAKEPGIFFTRNLTAGKFTVNRAMNPATVERQADGLAFYAPDSREVRPLVERESFGRLDDFLAKVRVAAGVTP